MTIKEAAEKLGGMFPDEHCLDVCLKLVRDGITKEWNVTVSAWCNSQRIEGNSWEELIARAERVIELRDRQSKPLAELEVA